MADDKMSDKKKDFDHFDPRLMAETPKPWDEWSLKDFEVGRPLGEGRFGHVYLVRTRREKYITALKVIHMKQLVEDDMMDQAERETDIHLDLDHENIIKMLGYFRDDDKLVYVLEYAPGGNVFTRLINQKNHHFSDSRAATYTSQVAKGLEYLHSRNIIHRDIKPENLLIGCFGEIKMADFGWSIKMKPKGQGRRRITICGTLDYLPPEMITGKPYDEKADFWCLGVLLYEFLVGSTPFEASNKGKTERKIASGRYSVPLWVTPEARDLIDKILKVDPNKRISLKELRNHHWIRHNEVRSKSLLHSLDVHKKEVFESDEFKEMYNGYVKDVDFKNLFK